MTTEKPAEKRNYRNNKTNPNTIDKKKRHETQAVVSRIQDNSFVVARKIRGGCSVFSKFQTYEGETPDETEHRSDVIVEPKIKHRIENCHEFIEPISSYTISNECIDFNCLKSIPTEVFPVDAASGWVHFNHFPKKTIEKDGTETIVSEIDDRIAYEEIPDELEIAFEQPTKISFNTKDMKVFPVFFSVGFALAVADSKKATLWISLSDVGRLYCGSTSQGELNNLIHNIFPIFPVFNAQINERAATVFLKNIGGLKPFLVKTGFEKALVRIRYEFADPTKCTLKILGKSTFEAAANE
jgi:hypothetical protein